jgi:hypothetical protein
MMAGQHSSGLAYDETAAAARDTRRIPPARTSARGLSEGSLHGSPAPGFGLGPVLRDAKPAAVHIAEGPLSAAVPRLCQWLELCEGVHVVTPVESFDTRTVVRRRTVCDKQQNRPEEQRNEVSDHPRFSRTALGQGDAPGKMLLL